MKWRSDPYWQDALAAAMRLSPEHEAVLTPDEFVGLRAAFRPAKEALAENRPGGGITAFVIPKDQAGLLPPHILGDGVERRFRCVFANEVFVIYSALAEELTLTAEMEQHVPAFLENRERVLRERAQTPGGRLGLVQALPYVLDTQRNRILQAMFPDQHYLTEQFEDMSGAPALLKREIFKYCVADVRLELSAYCNRSCGYCPVSLLENRKDKTAQMPWEMFTKCIDELARIGYDGIIYLCQYNEPLYDRAYLLKALDYMDRLLPECFVKLVSNGDYLTAEYFRELTKHRIGEFTISVHYSGTWDRETQRKRISEILARAGVPEKGALTEEDRRLIYYVDPGVYDSTHLKSLELRTEDFGVHGVDRAGSLESGVHKTDNRDHCVSPFADFSVAYDGTIVPCCNVCSDVPGAKEWCAGTLQEQGDIFTAYVSAKMAWLRRRLFAPRREGEYTPDICRTCAVACLDNSTLYRMDDPLRREIYDCWIAGAGDEETP